MRGVFESFESDLSRAHTHFRIWDHLDGSKFENAVFAPPPRCHVLDNRAAPPPPSLRKDAVLVLLLLVTPQIFFQLEYPRERFYTPGTSAVPRPRKWAKNLVLLLFLVLFWPAFWGLSKWRHPPHPYGAKKMLLWNFRTTAARCQNFSSQLEVLASVWRGPGWAQIANIAWYIYIYMIFFWPRGQKNEFFSFFK